MWSSVKDWAMVTSWHGVADLSRATSWCTRLFWFLILAMTTFLFCSQVTSHFQTYLSNDYPTDEHAASSGYEKAVGPLWKSEFDTYIEHHPDMKNLSLYDWMLMLGPDCTNAHILMFLKFDYIKNVCKEARQFFTRQRGLCYALEPINQNKIWENQTIPDSENTIHLWLNIDEDDYADITSKLTPQLGNTLFFGFDSVESTIQDRFPVSPGKHIEITINYYEHRAPKKSGLPIFDTFTPPLPCLEEAGKLNVIDTNVYTPRTCMLDCMSFGLYKFCDCLPRPTFPIRANSSIRRCSMNESVDCLQKHKGSLFTKCGKSCSKSLCAQRLVKFSATAAKYPANAANAARNIRNYYGIDMGAENVSNWAIVNVFYDRIVANVVQYQLRTSVEQLISNVGGQLGLWAGISIITLLQALVFLASGVFATVNNNWQKRTDLNNKSKVHMTRNSPADVRKNEEVETEVNTIKEELPDYMVEALQRYLAEKQNKKGNN